MRPELNGVGRGGALPTQHEHEISSAPTKSVTTGHAVADGQDVRTQGTSRETRTRSGIRTLASRIKSAGLKGTLVALLAGAFATNAMAQTSVGQGVPMNPVSVRVAQQKGLGEHADSLARLRTGHTLDSHQDRAGLLYPYIDAIRIPGDGTTKLGIETRDALWRMISIAAQEAEGTPDLTNMIPTSSVKSELVWQPTIAGPNDTRTNVLPLLLPQVANADGSLDEAKLMALFSRVNNPSPSASEPNVFLAENVGYQNGRAGYFTFNAINPEPIQPFSASGVMNLPQLILDVNGTKTVFTIGSLCYKGGGPSFQASSSSGYSYGYNAARQKTPLNENESRPIYAGNSTWGLFDYEANATANENGWMLLDAGAYAGVSIMQFKLKELVDYDLDQFGNPTGAPHAISIDQLQKDGRVSSSATPSLLWRAFATEYRLSAFKSPEHGKAVLDHMQRLFARDAVFDYIANDATLAPQWAAATEGVNNGDDPAKMQAVFDRALEGLNARIRAGEHTIKSPITRDADGVAMVTAKDYVNMAIQRSARNVVVLHKLGLNHGSIAAGGDNINAAWQMVDLDHLDKGYGSMPADPKDHSNVSEMTANLQMMIDDLKGAVPELKDFDGAIRDLLLQAIDREAPVFGKTAASDDRG